jgi:hypothetical protein
MPVTVTVKSADGAIRKWREQTAQRAIAHFGNRLPGFRLLCFLDDKDWPALRGPGMAANRGAFIKKGSHEWQEACTFVDGLPGFDNLIYLHGSTCSNEVGLTMTLAHELQHFVQYGTVPKLLAENELAYVTLRDLEQPDFEALGLRACDIPHEREARIVAKRAAEDLFGVAVVRRYIDAKVAEVVTQQDAADWECIQGLVTSAAYDLAAETKAFFPRLERCRSALEREQVNNLDFRDIDLDALLDGAGQ